MLSLFDRELENFVELELTKNFIMTSLLRVAKRWAEWSQGPEINLIYLAWAEGRGAPNPPCSRTFIYPTPNILMTPWMVKFDWSDITGGEPGLVLVFWLAGRWLLAGRGSPDPDETRRTNSHLDQKGGEKI